MRLKSNEEWAAWIAFAAAARARTALAPARAQGRGKQADWTAKDCAEEADALLDQLRARVDSPAFGAPGE